MSTAGAPFSRQRSRRWQRSPDAAPPPPANSPAGPWTTASSISTAKGSPTSSMRRPTPAAAGAGQASGALAQLYESWRTGLIEARALLEAAIDFSDEPDVEHAAAARGLEAAARLAEEIQAHLEDGRRGEIVREGFRIVLAGAPNVGKSSLMNALARRDVAIVSDEPGTTRDVLEVRLDLGGYMAIVADTAGMREATGAVEQEGIDGRAAGPRKPISSSGFPMRPHRGSKCLPIWPPAHRARWRPQQDRRRGRAARRSSDCLTTRSLHEPATDCRSWSRRWGNRPRAVGGDETPPSPSSPSTTDRSVPGCPGECARSRRPGHRASGRTAPARGGRAGTNCRPRRPGGRARAAWPASASASEVRAKS